MISQLSWRHPAEVLCPRILQGSIDSTWQENTTNEGPGMSFLFSSLSQNHNTLYACNLQIQEIWKLLRLKLGNFWTCQSFLWWPGHFFLPQQSLTIRRVEGSQLCGTIQSLKRNHPMNHILESATGSDCAPGVLVERDRGKSQKTSRKGTNLDVSQQSPGTFFHLTNFFLASFSAWRPYKSDNKLQRPLKLHQHISGMEPNLFQPLQKPRPSTRPHHGPLAGQIHDVQPPQGWQSKFFRPIAEWTNPLNIYQLRCDDSRFWSCQLIWWKLETTYGSSTVTIHHVHKKWIKNIQNW